MKFQESASQLSLAVTSQFVKIRTIHPTNLESNGALGNNECESPADLDEFVKITTNKRTAVQTLESPLINKRKFETSTMKPNYSNSTPLKSLIVPHNIRICGSTTIKPIITSTGKFKI